MIPNAAIILRVDTFFFQMNIQSFRPVMKCEVGIDRRSVLLSSMEGKISPISTPPMYVNVPVDTLKVPLMVSKRQFDVINFRRQVRCTIERSRAITGRPVNGRRSGSFRYVQKHLHARSRVRGTDGTFVTIRPHNERILSICK